VYKSIIGSIAGLLLAGSVHAAVITHVNNPADISSSGYIEFSHTNAYSASNGAINSLELDLNVWDIDGQTDLQASINGAWATVGAFGTGPSKWKVFNVGLGATVISELISTGSLNFRFNEAQSSGWYATYADSELTMAVSAVPEPASIALHGVGLAGIGFARRRGSRQS
jgi:hypothetical protein